MSLLLFYFSNRLSKKKKNGTNINKKIDVEVNDKNFDNNYFKSRNALVSEWKKIPEIHPYPHKFQITLTLKSFIEKFNHIKNNEILNEVKVNVAGRVHSIRNASSKLHFVDMRSDGHKIQVMASASSYNENLDFTFDIGRIKRGDIIGVEGSPMRTNNGELSIIPQSVSKHLLLCYDK